MFILTRTNAIFQNQCLLRLQYLPLIEILNRTKGFLTCKYSMNDEDCLQCLRIFKNRIFQMTRPKSFLAVAITNWLMFRVWVPFGQTTFSCRIKKQNRSCIGTKGIFIRPDFYNTIKVKHCH